MLRKTIITIAISAAIGGAVVLAPIDASARGGGGGGGGHTATPPGGGDATERIGADPNNSLYFSGTLDDVRLYNRALRHRNKTTLQRRPVMQRRWSFNQG
jgi:hypothetical protein